MKIRTGFVSNSSSSSFIITNTSSVQKTLKDFVIENEFLILEFNDMYCANYTLMDVLSNKKLDDEIFKPNESREMIFGDEDGTTIGKIYDYILRESGKSNNFTWKFHESLR